MQLKSIYRSMLFLAVLITVVVGYQNCGGGFKVASQTGQKTISSLASPFQIFSSLSTSSTGQPINLTVTQNGNVNCGNSTVGWTVQNGQNQVVAASNSCDITFVPPASGTYTVTASTGGTSTQRRIFVDDGPPSNCYATGAFFQFIANPVSAQVGQNIDFNVTVNPDITDVKNPDDNNRRSLSYQILSTANSSVVKSGIAVLDVNSNAKISFSSTDAGGYTLRVHAASIDCGVGTSKRISGSFSFQIAGPTPQPTPPAQICTPDSVLSCRIVSYARDGMIDFVMGKRTCNARGTAWGPCIPIELPPATKDCDVIVSITWRCEHGLPVSDATHQTYTVLASQSCPVLPLAPPPNCDEPPPTPTPVCAANSTKACTKKVWDDATQSWDFIPGTQTCKADGSGWLACDINQPPPPPPTPTPTATPGSTPTCPANKIFNTTVNRCMCLPELRDACDTAVGDIFVESTCTCRPGNPHNPLPF